MFGNMKTFKAVRNISIRSRLALLLALNASLALLLAGVFLFAHERFERRESALRTLSTQARIVGASSTAALSAADERAAAEVLTALRADPDLWEAAVYDRHGRLFAWFERGPSTVNPSAKPPKTGVYFEKRYLSVCRPILLGRQRIGTISLRASLKEVNSVLNRSTGAFCLILLASLGVALLLSARMQRTITEPIAELAGAVRRVSRDQDYSVRAVRHATDEIGLLIDSFNEMLSRIEIREDARKKAEESLRESEERYALAARGANDGLWDWKLTTGEIYFSQRWNRMLGASETEKWTDPEEWFSRVHPSDRDRLKAEICEHCEGNTAEFVSEYRMRNNRGAFIWMLSRGIAVRDASGLAVRLAGSQTDITEAKIADPLTGLPNRLYFLDRLESSIDAARYTRARSAVLFLDLDRFKLINDSMGHAAGDQLLEGISARLRARVQEFDAAQGGQVQSIASRLGGDEFGILLNLIAQPAAIPFAWRSGYWII